MSTSSFEAPQDRNDILLSPTTLDAAADEHHNSTVDKARFGGTLLLTSVLSYDFVPLIAIGERIKDSGVNGWVAGGIIAAVTAVESTGTSYLATAGIGDFKYEPKSNIGKKIAEFTPLVSLSRGAPTGVALDAAAGKQIDLRRRLEHAVPYALAVGFWVTPNPLSETVVNTVASAPKAIYESATDHPKLSGGLAIGAAVAAAAVMKRRKSKKQ